MSSIRGKLGLGLVAVVTAAGLWACAATRNSDGSISLSFAPDMTIHASGLEDALDKLTDLLGACVSGTFHRTCTDAERQDIEDAMNRVLDSKDRARDSTDRTVGGMHPV